MIPTIDINPSLDMYDDDTGVIHMILDESSNDGSSSLLVSSFIDCSSLTSSTRKPDPPGDYSSEYNTSDNSNEDSQPTIIQRRKRQESLVSVFEEETPSEIHSSPYLDDLSVITAMPSDRVMPTPSEQVQLMGNAIMQNDMTTLHSLLASNYDPNAQMPISGTTALDIAARLGNVTAIKVLIQFNANVNLPNSYGETALLIAILHRCPETVELLLSNGADAFITTKSGATALDYARRETSKAVNQSIVRMLQQQRVLVTV